MKEQETNRRASIKRPTWSQIDPLLTVQTDSPGAQRLVVLLSTFCQRSEPHEGISERFAQEASRSSRQRSPRVLSSGKANRSRGEIDVRRKRLGLPKFCLVSFGNRCDIVAKEPNRQAFCWAAYDRGRTRTVPPTLQR
jgi:hypothetical protein